MSYIIRLIWNSRCSPFIHIGHNVNMRCLSLSHNAPQKQHFICAPWVYYNHKLWFVFPSPVCRIFFFKDIKWPIRSVSGCLGVQFFWWLHTTRLIVHGMCHRLAYAAQAGRRTRVSSHTGRHVIGLQLLNEISTCSQRGQTEAPKPPPVNTLWDRLLWTKQM